MPKPDDEVVLGRGLHIKGGGVRAECSLCGGFLAIDDPELATLELSKGPRTRQRPDLTFFVHIPCLRQAFVDEHRAAIDRANETRTTDEG